MDLKLEDDQKHIAMTDITTELRLGTRSMHTCNMATAKDGTPVATPVPLSSKISNERITFVVKAKGLAENIGSVSIPQFIVLNGGLNTYEQWITLFEHEEDDEYDGEMGLNDDEEPMLQIKFEICQDEKPQTSASAKATSTVTKTTTTTTMTSTGRLEGRVSPSGQQRKTTTTTTTTTNNRYQRSNSKGSNKAGSSVQSSAAKTSNSRLGSATEKYKSPTSSAQDSRYSDSTKKLNALKSSTSSKQGVAPA